MKPFTVSEITHAIKAQLEPTFRDLSIRGEISNFKQQSSGHLYFQLKDAGAQMSAVLFKKQASFLSRLPKEGDQVIACGDLSVYTPRGQYQIVVRTLEFAGAGELLLRLQQLKQSLQAKGRFDPQHKKPLPSLPKRIGVITSPTGAAVQDILHVLNRRFAGLHVLIYPVKVQGEGAAQEIAQAVRECNRYALADVLIVGRGGGSIEDLWAFNEECVVEAFFASQIPIVSAVGHETDFTLADSVADVRAPTPSAAAEIITSEKAHLVQRLLQTELQLRQRIQSQISQSRRHLKSLQKHPWISSPTRILTEPAQKLDLLQTETHQKLLQKLKETRQRCYYSAQRLQALRPSLQITRIREKLSQGTREVRNRLLQGICQRRDKLAQIEQHLRSLHPQNLLKKGYVLLFSEKEDSIILSSKDLSPNTNFTALLHDGQVKATVTQMEEHERKSLSLL